jgi:oligoendopeptidase F
VGRSVEFPDLWSAPSPNSEICAVSFELMAISLLEPLYGKNLRFVLKRRIQEALSQAVYAAAINAFEQQVYTQPSMSAADRRRFWIELERRFTPWRKYGDIPLAGEGGLWLDQRHIFTLPLYYCDYAIASQSAVALYSSRVDFRSKIELLHERCSTANMSPPDLNVSGRE